MPKSAARLRVVTRRDPQLQCLNEKIARLAAQKPWNDIYRAFAFTAQLADDAIEAGEELQEMPGTDRRILQPALAKNFRRCREPTVAFCNPP